MKRAGSSAAIALLATALLMTPACSDDTSTPRDASASESAVDGPGGDTSPADARPLDGGLDGDAGGSDGPAPAAGYVGFGAVTRGAASSPTGFDVYHVTKLDDDGSPGTLRDAVSRGRRRIVFDVAGTITLTSRLTIAVDYLTIDGATAGGAGITIAQAPNTTFGVLVAGTKRHTHDLVISYVRFRGSYDVVSTHVVGTAILGFDADCGKLSCAATWDTVDAGISAVVLDHVVLAYDRDKLTFWGKIRDVTLSNSLFYGSNKALLLSFYGAAYDLERDGVSIHRNALLENDERNPQVRGSTRALDIVNNVIYGWGVYGVRIKNEAGEGKVDANIVNNTFIDANNLGGAALIYLDDVEPGSCLAQGDVYTQSTMGKLWVAGNTLPANNCDKYSTVSVPLTIPARATLPSKPAAAATCDVLASAGLEPGARTADETTRLARARAAAGCP